MSAPKPASVTVGNNWQENHSCEEYRVILPQYICYIISAVNTYSIRKPCTAVAAVAAVNIEDNSYCRAVFSALLTYKALGSNQFQGYFISQDGGVAMGDVGKRARVDKHRGSLWKYVIQNP